MQIECWTPLRDCVRTMDVAMAGSDLVLGIGAPVGPECTEPWGNTKARLPRTDFSELLASMYVGSEDARARILEALPSQAGGEGPAPLTREIVALLFREVYGSEARRLPRAKTLVGSPYRELLQRCGHPGSETCPTQRARHVAKEIGAEFRRVVAKQLAPPPAPLFQPAPGWFGSWLGPLGTRGPGVVELQPGEDGRPVLTFDSELVLDFPACKGKVFPMWAASAEVECGPCAHRLAFRIDGTRMLVRLLGNAWRPPSTQDCSFWRDEGQYVFSLTRVDALRVFAPGYMKGMSESDLGSSGGQIGLVKANRLGRIIERAYREAGRDPARLTVSAMIELTVTLYAALAFRCGDPPGDDPPSRCGQAAIEAEAKVLVEGWIAERGLRAP
jgi:hypothetical protein